MLPRDPAADPVKTLAGAQDRFIATWGQMGSAWGISRTMAEVHALLYITGAPLNTDDVMDRLQISRGNASMSLRALVEWGLVARIHKRGDRKEYFQAETDVWTMFRTIVRERIKREMEPVLASLYEIRDMTGDARLRPPHAPGPPESEVVAEAVKDHNARLDAMVETLETIDKLSHRFVSPSGVGLKLAASALSKFV